MIASFKDKEAEALFKTRNASKRLAPYAEAALRKLAQVHAAGRIDDLAVPPGNQLKKLGGTADVWQIRIERQHPSAFAGTAETPTTWRLAIAEDQKGATIERDVQPRKVVHAG